MQWSDLTCNWAAAYATLQQHFPQLEDSAMPFVKQDRNRFAAYLATRHALTHSEAIEAIDDFLLVQTLWRDRIADPQLV